MSTAVQTPRLPFPGGNNFVQAASLSVRIQSALVFGENDLHCFISNVQVEMRVETFLHCWDPASADRRHIEDGAKIFDDMKARVCTDDLPESEHQSAHFALLLQVSYGLSHRLELAAERHTELTTILDNREHDFNAMQDEVYGFFARQRMKPQAKAETAQPSHILLPQPAQLEQIKAWVAPQSDMPAATAQPKPVQTASDKQAIVVVERKARKTRPTAADLALSPVRAPAKSSWKPSLPRLNFNPGLHLAASRINWLRLSQKAMDALVAVKAMPRQFNGLVDALAVSRPVCSAKFAYEVVRSNIERVASKAGHGLITAGSNVATGIVKGVHFCANAIKSIFKSGYERL